MLILKVKYCEIEYGPCQKFMVRLKMQEITKRIFFLICGSSKLDETSTKWNSSDCVIKY